MRKAPARNDLPGPPERALIRPPEEGATGGGEMPATTKNSAALRDITRELAALTKMGNAALRERYREAFGEETTSHNAAYLRKRIAWRIQELAEGGLTDRAKRRLAELAENAPLRERPPEAALPIEQQPAARAPRPHDPRLPPVGDVLTKVYQGRVYEVKVTMDGFIYAGKRYTSLSTIAKLITGTTWNGRLFFGLTTRKKKEAA
jgi:hypothetical protein